MSTHSKIPLSFEDHRKVVDQIREAWYSKRPIVPIVGAGLSAASGFPVLKSIVHYLASIYAISEEYCPFQGKKMLPKEMKEKIKERYFKKTWNLIEDYGWPDRFFLYQELSRILKQDSKKISDVIPEKLTEIAKIINPNSWYNYEELVKTITKKYNVGREEFDKVYSDSKHFGIYGDWRKLIQHITRFNADYADSLFAAMGLAKEPNLGQRYLVFLCRLLSIRTVFTFNFDDLIERSFEAEGIKTRVFSMEEGKSLPHSALTANAIMSVIKMHGSTHSLLIDERLDRPVNDDYVKRFYGLVGENPLLVVMGCSGGDVRLTSLVEKIIQDNESKNKNDISIIWLKFEDYKLPFIEEGVENSAVGPDRAYTSRNGVIVAETTNPAHSLVHIYSALTNRFPASQIPYASSGISSFGYRKKYDNNDKNDEPPYNFATEELLRAIFYNDQKIICVSSLEELKDIDDIQTKSFPRITASEAMLDVANKGLYIGYTPIIINLECTHTLAGLVDAIMAQCKQYDTQLVPGALPVESNKDIDDDTIINKAMHLLSYTLQRSRYLVILDGLDNYLWNVTSHHGESTLDKDGCLKRFELLCKFINEFYKSIKKSLPYDIGESKVIIAIDARTTRSDSKATTMKIEKMLEVDCFKNTVIQLGSELIEYSTVLNFDNEYNLCTFGDRKASMDMLALYLLAACRRTRPLAQIRHLLRPIFKDSNETDKFILSLVKQDSGMTLLVGGSLSISRPIRNRIYNINNQYTSRAQVNEALSSKFDKLKLSIFHLLMSYFVHFRLTRTYYVYTFGQSNDALAFLEYTYHRISALRSLCKLIYVLKSNENNFSAIQTGFRQVHDFFGDDNFDSLRHRFQINDINSHLYRAITSDISNLSELVGELIKRHAKELRSLSQAWYRHEVTLRKQIPAQQLLHWCDRMLEDDFKYRLDCVVTDYQDSTAVLNNSFVSMFVTGPLPQVKKQFRDLKIKLLAERGDYLAVLHARWSDITETPFDVNANYSQIQLKKDCDLHDLLDAANAAVKLGHTSPTNRKYHSIADCLLKPEIPAELDVDYLNMNNSDKSTQEAYLRYYHLKSEFLFGFDSFFVALSDLPDGFADNIKRVLKLSDDAMERSRRQYPTSHDSPRSVIIDRTADRTLYPQYRTVFDMIRGRAKCYEAYNSDINEASSKFEDSFRFFDLARAGLEGSNSLLRAIVEIYAAEAALIQGSFELKIDPVEGLKKAGAKHETARTALDAARELLLVSRVNATWWQFFYQMVAQYEAERLSLIGLASTSSSISDLSSPLTRFRRGLRAIRNAINFQVDPNTSNLWLKQIFEKLNQSFITYMYKFLQIDIPNSTDRKDFIIQYCTEIYQSEWLTDDLFPEVNQISSYIITATGIS
ncbi:MAG: SIR2 family protein [Zavarzinella sp.]